MNDIIAFIGIGLLLVAIPVLIARSGPPKVK